MYFQATAFVAAKRARDASAASKSPAQTIIPEAVSVRVEEYVQIAASYANVVSTRSDQERQRCHYAGSATRPSDC